MKPGDNIVDCFDLQIEIQPVSFDDMANTTPAESSEAIRLRVIEARAVQQLRSQGKRGIYCNAQMNSRLLHKYAWPDEKVLAWQLGKLSWLLYLAAT